MSLSNLTGLGRPIDLAVPSNKLAVIGTLVGGLVSSLAAWADSGTVDPLAGLPTAIAVFVAWAIGRELDPDHTASAGLAMAIALTFSLTAGVEAGGAAILLIGIRMMVGTVGLKLKPVDYGVLLLAAGYAGVRPETWPAAAVIVLALLVDRPSGFRLTALAAAAVAIAAGFMTNPSAAWDTSLAALAVASFGVLAALASVPVSKIVTRNDRGTAVISAARVSGARLSSGAAIAIGSLISGASFSVIAPVLAASVAVAVVSLILTDSMRLAGKTLSPASE